MTNETKAVTMKPCGECGMLCDPAEYHPFTACLLFKQTHDDKATRDALNAVYEHARAAITSEVAQAPFQSRVQPWMLECFGAEIAADKIERNHRFFEEATETVQANGMTRSEAHQLVDYTFDRPVGELHQEIGGVMVTLAALCLASGQDMHAAGETELARIWTKVEAIRAKQAAKPKHSPLPAAPVAPTPETTSRYIVIGYGESDYPMAAFANEPDELLDAVLGMIYTNPSDADESTRLDFAADLADENEWCAKVWSTEFEIGGITVYDTGGPALAATAPSDAEKAE